MSDVEWSVSSHRQSHGSSNCCGARCNIFIHLATTIPFAKLFTFKLKIKTEGLPRDSPAGLGAGGPESNLGAPLKSRIELGFPSESHL
jgi:hypothetical protein